VEEMEMNGKTEKHRILIIGSVISIALLFVLGYLQVLDSKFLNLQPHWIAVAVIPVLIALFVGGVITRFQGFGVELEADLQKPVESATSGDLTVADAVETVKGDEKDSYLYLEKLSSKEKLSIRRLIFTSDRQHYYEPEAIATYIRELPNLEYFEIQTESKEIICLIPKSTFLDPDILPPNVGTIPDKLGQFVQAIENDDVPRAFVDSAITLKVSNDQSLVNVLKRMRIENVEFAPVIGANGKYMGVVFAKDIERRIANSVLANTDA
jgi:hypothetical protein